MVDINNNQHAFLMQDINSLIEATAEFITVFKHQQELVAKYLQHPDAMHVAEQLSSELQTVQAQKQIIGGAIAKLSVTAHLESEFNKLLTTLEAKPSRLLTWFSRQPSQKANPAAVAPSVTNKLQR